MNHIPHSRNLPTKFIKISLELLQSSRDSLVQRGRFGRRRGDSGPGRVAGEEVG